MKETANTQTENTRFTDYMNKSLKFRTQLNKYMSSRGEDLSIKVSVFNLLDKVDHKSEKNQEFRNEFFKWLSNAKGYSTIKLREFCKIVDVDYWRSLKESNVIDVFDSCSCLNS
jgi:hypothetical protein